MKNSRLIFEPGNQWTKDSAVAPYFAIPAWWRRFLYQVLTPREFVVYCYLGSVFDPNGIAYPTIEQIRQDLGIKSAVVVSRALDRLVELGFILRGRHSIKGRLLGRRPVYQRPLAAYTLATLLERDMIDGRLFPKVQSERTADFTNSAIELGLKKILGDNLYTAYSVASDRIKSAVLLEGLRRTLARSLVGAHERAQQLPHDLPEPISAMIAEDQGVPF